LSEVRDLKPSTRISISRDETRAVYAQGEEAVIALVESLVERINAHEERIECLENQRKKDSHNSSKPPSGDGFGKRTQSLRPKGERSSGGQKGHPGSTLEWSETLDAVVVHPTLECEACGASLQDVAVIDLDLRQVHDLPEVKLVVSEHRAEVKSCPHCGVMNRGAFPPDVNSVVQYGSGLKGLMVYLMEGQLLPSARVSEVLREVLGCEISEATLYNARERCHGQLEAVEAHLRAGMQTAEVGHFDETGLRVVGKLMWLHVACTEGLTYYFIHAKRGQAAMDEMDVLPNFGGISVHDGWSSYGRYDCTHALCNAHHLRELKFVVERYEQPWADEMMTLLLEIKAQVEIAKTAGHQNLAPAQVRDFEQQYQALIEQGLKANPPPPVDPAAVKAKGRAKQSPPKNLLDRLQTKQAAVLAFTADFRVPFDNNQAERDIRMMKLKQKISGSFRSLEGAQMFCRIRGYISTLRKQGIEVLDALRRVFVEDPIFPALKPE